MVSKIGESSSKKVWIIIALIFIIVISVIGYNYIKYKKEKELSQSFEVIYYGLKNKKLDDSGKKDLAEKLDEKFKKECEESNCKVREIYFYVSALQRLGIGDKVLLQKEFLKNVMMEHYKNSFDISNEISEDTFFTLILMHRLEQFRKTQADFWRLELSKYKYENLFDRFKQTLLLRTLTNGIADYEGVENKTQELGILKKNICTDIPSYKSILKTEQLNSLDDDALAPIYDYAYVKSFCKSSFSDEDKDLFEKIANKNFPTTYGTIQKDIIINIGIKGLF